MSDANAPYLKRQYLEADYLRLSCAALTILTSGIVDTQQRDTT